MTTLGNALIRQSHLRQSVKAGVQALLPRDIALILQTERVKVGDSLDLDTASRAEFPQSNRWDYLLSVPGIRQIIALEPHTARDSEVAVIIAKRSFAISYLQAHLQPRYRITAWYWVSSGPVNFSSMERLKRRLDQNGITFVGRQLRQF